MALPTINDVQPVEPILTNMLQAYLQDARRFVAGQVFPAVSVANDSGTFFKFDKKYWFTDELAQRAPGGPFATVEFGLSTDTYKTVQYAADYALADEIRANSQVPMALESAAVQFLAQKSLLRKEIDWAGTFFTTGVWGTDNNSATDWDDYSGGDPILDIETAKNVIMTNTGQMANVLVVGPPVHAALLNHPDIIGRVQYVQKATRATIEDSLAAVFGLDRYLVGYATRNTANEGAAASMSNIFDDDALLLVVNGSAGIMDATAGKTFTWQPGGGSGSMYSYYEDGRHATVIQHKEQWDHKVVGSDLGYFWTDIV